MKLKFVIGLFIFLYVSMATAGVNKALTDDSKILNGLVTVAAVNDEWTATNIRVVPGDILLTIEQGNKIVVGTYIGSTGANGINNGTGALQLKIGSGASQIVGVKGFVVVNESGIVKLKVNDTNYNDNSGEYKVNIIHIPGGLIPSSKDVSAE